MLSHGYIKNDVEVRKWFAPEFLEQAAKELIEERWQKVTSAELPKASILQASTQWLGQSEGLSVDCRKKVYN